MADRNNHYEAAFEAYLRHKTIPYVAVDEAKRALFANARLKSFDFVVYCPKGANRLVDIKGRKAQRSASPSALPNWCTEQDVTDLMQWEQIFGSGFSALLAFIYWIEPPLLPEPGHFAFRDRWYLLMGVQLDEYRGHMRRRSAKWGTVCLTTRDFQSLARPLESWL